MKTKQDRINDREKAINHAKQLEKDLGTRGGTLYEKHIEKIEKQPGRYAKGSLSHYIQCKPNIKSRGKEYGRGTNKCVRLSAQEMRQIEDQKEQLNEYLLNNDNENDN